MLQTSRAAFSLDPSSTFSSSVTNQPARFDLRAGVDAKQGPRAEGWRFALDQAQRHYYGCNKRVNAQDTSAEPKPDLPLEIAHLLLIDVVGYSKLLVNEQIELLQDLNQIVRNTECFRAAETSGKLIRVPTGDGMALLFFRSPEEPVRCALEVSRALQDHSRIRLRMGIHSGPVNRVTDVNDKTNFAGSGINVAQRVLDCGDAGHILLSAHVAEDLAHYPHWQPCLHDLGKCEVKHGLRLHLFNLCKENLGNPQVPEKLRRRRRWKQESDVVRPISLSRRPRSLLVLALVVAALAMVISSLTFFQRVSLRMTRATPPEETASKGAVLIPEKSIAVLPFENRSEDKANAYFADGIKDEILMRLSKVADLKVISRTSTQHYKSAPENLPEIARQLGVAQILEGSVEKNGDTVRVNVRLIKATNDSQLWGDIFDRKLTDVFAVESDIAKTIAEALRAKLTGSEEQMMSKKPTENTEAYELYLKGRFFWNKRTGADLRKAIEYFGQAVSKDPNYALAYAGLADSYQLLSGYGAASPQDSIPQAKAAVKRALELDDTLGEAHATSARILAVYDFEFDRSIAEFERAIRLNSNYAMAHHWFGMGPLMALGQFDRAIAEGKRAVELDPLSLIDNADFGWIYFNARRYDEAIAQLRKTIDMDSRFYLAHYYLGQALQFKGQLTEAIAEYRTAVELDDEPVALAFLGHAYARAGQRNEAQKILDRLTQEAKSRYVSAYSFALVLTGLGDKDGAIEALERAYLNDEGHDIYIIKVDPMLDDLRGQARFEALVQKAAERATDGQLKPDPN